MGTVVSASEVVGAMDSPEDICQPKYIHANVRDEHFQVLVWYRGRPLAQAIVSLKVVAL